MNQNDAVLPPPWWVKRIRDGSLFSKRLKHWLGIALLGFSWYMSDLYGMVMNWISRLEFFLSWVDGYPEAKFLWQLLTNVGTAAATIATAWTLVWIYCDSACTVAEAAQWQTGATRSSVKKATWDLFWQTTLWAVVVGFAIYLIAWMITKHYGLWDFFKAPRLSLPGGMHVPLGSLVS